MYSLNSNKEDSDVPTHQSPNLILQDDPLPIHLKEVHSSPVTEKISYEWHSVIQEEEHPSSYNIEEIFNSFTFNLYEKEVNRKRVWNVKQSDGTMQEIQEDEVLFKKTDEDQVKVATTSTNLS